MRVKKRKIPIKIIVNDITVSRLSLLHPKRQLIITDTKKYQSGYTGERKLDYNLNLEKSDKFYNLQDMRLELSRQFFQMDSVVLSPSFIVDLEVKNLSGVLKYDSLNKQVLQYHNNKLTNKYPDPVLQSEQHLIQLDYWLQENNFRVPPLETLIVVTNPDALIDFDCKNESTTKIIYPHAALHKIQELKRIYTTPALSPMEINAISRTMIEKHTPEDYDVLKKYGLFPDEILPGVRCPNCRELTMVWKYRTWFCPNCKIHSANAHVLAILEYLLIHSTITPAQCRNFLRLTGASKNVVTTFLNEIGLEFTGTTRNRVYYLPIEELLKKYLDYKLK